YERQIWASRIGNAIKLNYMSKPRPARLAANTPSGTTFSAIQLRTVWIIELVNVCCVTIVSSVDCDQTAQKPEQRPQQQSGRVVLKKHVEHSVNQVGEQADAAAQRHPPQRR